MQPLHLVSIVLSVATVAYASGSSDALILKRDYRIPSADRGIELSVRAKTPAGKATFAADEVVVFVHGHGLPSRPAFDVPHPDASWAEWMARRGYAVLLFDLRNCGSSTHERAMEEPPERNPAPSRSYVAVRDVAAVVDHARSKHAVEQVVLVGWSWGATLAGYYASLHPEKVRRLVLYAPIYRGSSPAKPFEPSGAYAYLPATADVLRERWGKVLPIPAGSPPREDAIIEAVAAELRASDPTSAFRNPPTIRYPQGASEDLHLARTGRPLWNASSVYSPTLVIVGDHDPFSPPEHAEALMADLTHATLKRRVVIKDATHIAQFEPKRFELFEEVLAFLREPVVAVSKGR